MHALPQFHPHTKQKSIFLLGGLTGDHVGTCGQLPAPPARGCVPREHPSVNWLRQASLAVRTQAFREGGDGEGGEG
jgi:hypothetical protein